MAVIEVSDTGPGFPVMATRASVRGVPGLQPRRRHRPRPCHRRRADPRPRRQHRAGRGHHRRDIPHYHPGPGGGARRPPQRAAGVIRVLSFRVRRHSALQTRKWLKRPGMTRLCPRAHSCQTGVRPYSYRRSAPWRGSAAFSTACAPVAQLDRAPDYESGGQEFESLRARQKPQQLLTFRVQSPVLLPLRGHAGGTKHISALPNFLGVKAPAADLLPPRATVCRGSESRA